MAVIQFKRGSTATLLALQTPPAAGEPVWDKELEKLKVGDGTRLYSELPYVGDVSVDNSSIEFDPDKLISIFGFSGAEDDSSPVKNSHGIIEWKVLASKEDLEDVEATLSDELAEISDYIEGILKPQLDGIEDDISNIRNDIIHVQQEQQALDHSIDEIRDTLDEIDPEKIEAAIEKVETFDGRLDHIDDDLYQAGGIVDRLEAVEAKNEEQDDTLEDHETRIKTLEESGGFGPDDIFIIDGGTAFTCLVEAHDPEHTTPEEEP